jgi:hypothetical protein
MFTWTIAVYTIWLRAHLDLKLQGEKEVPGRYKSVRILASAIDQGMPDISEKSDALTNRQLRHRVAKNLNGGRVEMTNPFPVKYNFRTELWAWMKKIKWWLLLAAFGIAVGFTAWGMLPLTLGTIFAVTIGRTNGSRTIIALGGFVISMPFIALYIVLMLGFTSR